MRENRLGHTVYGGVKNHIDKKQHSFLIYMNPPAWFVAYIDFLYQRKVAGYNFFNSFQDPSKNTLLVSLDDTIKELHNSMLYNNFSFYPGSDEYYIIDGMKAAARDFSKRDGNQFLDITNVREMIQSFDVSYISIDGLHPSVKNPHITVDLTTHEISLPDSIKNTKNRNVPVFIGVSMSKFYRFIIKHPDVELIRFQTILAPTKFKSWKFKNTPRGFYRALQLVLV